MQYIQNFAGLTGQQFCPGHTPDPAIAHIYEAISLSLQLPGETLPPFEQQGLIATFNGVDIQQTCHYIQISTFTCIRQLLAAHN
jgi:hypothetical protein